MHILFNPTAWASLLTLTALEIILGIDNIVVLSILTNSLPAKQARRARGIGLGMALAFRLGLLSVISWMTRLTTPVFELFGQGFSWRDLILIAGGLFLIAKATQEVHTEIEGDSEESDGRRVLKASFTVIILQIAAMDVIFSLDSIITAIGMAQQIEIMIAAICIAIVIMYIAAGTVSSFIQRHPTTKMLALSFLMLIGVALVADGFGFHLPRGYLYFAMTFSAIVEAFNVMAKSRKSRLENNMIEAHSKTPPAKTSKPTQASTSNPPQAALRTRTKGKSGRGRRK